MKKLEWNVYVADFNSKEVKKYNIFNHFYFKKDCDKAWSECKDKNGFINTKFAEDIRKNLAYYFWSKCEWEIVISSFPESDRFKDKKVDVYEQVMLNWEHFMNYLWNYYISEVYE